MAQGLVKSGKSIQVVVGMTVPQVREAFEHKWLRINRPKIILQKTHHYTQSL